MLCPIICVFLLQCREDLCDGRNVHPVRYGEFILVYTWSGLNSGIENGLSYSLFIMHSTSALAIRRRMHDLELNYVHCEDKDECPPDSAQASTPSKTRFPSQVLRSH